MLFKSPISLLIYLSTCLINYQVVGVKKSSVVIVGLNIFSLILISFCFIYIKGRLLSADTVFDSWISLFVLITRKVFISC